jgi:hypothetical protein
LAIQEDSTIKPRTGPELRLRRSAIRAVLLLGVFFIVLGVAAPFINASAFRTSIQRQMEESLGRKVEIGDVHFALFTGPGFSLSRVTIQEDEQYGLEPFAYIPTMRVRVRVDKLLIGQVRLLSLRLEDPSLNFVKKDDGNWNVVALVERLGAPRRTPLNFVPAFEVSNGRIDLKFGTRKATLYITQTDLSIYPQRSGKIYIKFEGSPARTDRAGNGFGHLHGTANWYLTPASASANQLESDVTLDQSNLSELTTLFEGQDLGVHGNISGRVRISGPASDLRAAGEIRLQNVHRWDLIPSPGDDWHIPFQASVDLTSHVLNLRTVPSDSGEPAPAVLQLRINDFMAKPAWSVLASLHKAPINSVLPLARKMGLMLPQGLKMDGSMDGVVGYSNVGGLEGGVAVTNAVAVLPNVPTLQSALANIKISSGVVHIAPAVLQQSLGGTLQAGVDYTLATQELSTGIDVNAFPIAALKKTTAAWFASPDALSELTDGTVTGNFNYHYQPVAPGATPVPAVWAGQFQLTNAVLSVPGIATTLKHMQGRGTFDAASFDLPHFTALLGTRNLSGSYHYSLGAKHPERLRLDLPVADLSELEAALRPALSDDGLLSRLPFTRRTIPPWLASRNMEGDIAIRSFAVNGTPLGRMASHFLWQGTSLQLTNVQVLMPAGQLHGSGSIALNSYSPRFQFALAVEEFPWAGGTLSADGTLDTTGLDKAMLQSLHASGNFSGEDITLSGAAAFSQIGGLFELAFDGDAPVLRLTKLLAKQDDQDWSGEATTRSDGKLYVELTNGDRQIHAVANITPAAEPAAFNEGAQNGPAETASYRRVPHLLAARPCALCAGVLRNPANQ